MGQNIDATALAQARERLHYAAESALDEERTYSRARAADLRLVLDALREARDLMAELTALDFGCASGDCPHDTKEECRVWTEGQMKQIAQEARSYFPTPKEQS